MTAAHCYPPGTHRDVVYQDLMLDEWEPPTEWPNVDVNRVRTVADVNTWEELDYLLCARASMIPHQLAILRERHQRTVELLRPDYYSMASMRREGVQYVLGIRFVPPLSVPGMYDLPMLAVRDQWTPA